MSINSFDSYTDCPTREQRAWTGDSVVHQMVDLTTNADWRLARWHPTLTASPRSDGMLPMAVIAAWLGAAPDPVYGHYLGTLGPAAIHDQRLAAMIMLAAALPAFWVPVLARMHVSTNRRAQPSLSGGLNQAHSL